MFARTFAAAAAIASICGSSAAGEMADLAGASAYVAGPEDAAARVLIVHDWFGLTPSTKAEAEWFGQQGIRAVAIDLYGGRAARTHDEAGALMNGLDPAAASAIIHGTLEAIGAGQQPVVIVGYSMGGNIALKAQVADQQMIAGAALVYGSGYENIPDAQLRGLDRPLLVATGSKDADAVSAMDALQRRMSDFGHPIETYVYPGVDHAYAQSLFNDGKNFDLDATMATRNVVEDFVKRASGGAS